MNDQCLKIMNMNYHLLKTVNKLVNLLIVNIKTLAFSKFTINKKNHLNKYKTTIKYTIISEKNVNQL